MGIMLGGIQGLIIRDCYFRNQPDSGSHDEGGIDFEAGGNGCLIDHCTFENNAGAAIEVLGLKSPQTTNIEIRGSRFIRNNTAKKLGPSEIFIWGRVRDPSVCRSTGVVEGNGYVLLPGIEFFVNEAPELTSWTLQGNTQYATVAEIDRAMPLNRPPVVDAGADIRTDRPRVALAGSIRDDGKPSGKPLSIIWELLQRPEIAKKSLDPLPRRPDGPACRLHLEPLLLESHPGGSDCQECPSKLCSPQEFTTESMAMRLVLLGTTGYHPNEQRHTPCMLLPECGVMFDAGTAMFRAPRFLETPTLDIFLTHAHLDHIIGLTYLFSVVRQHPLERVRVFAEEEKLTAIREHLFSEHIFPVRPPMEFCALKTGQEIPLPNGGRVAHFPVEHVGSTVGYRIDWPDRSMAYVTDTTAALDADYVERIRGVDLLVHECYFPDGHEDWAAKTGHSCTTPVAQVAKAAGVRRLVMVHVDPVATDADPVGLDAARRVFPNTELGRDLDEIEF